MALAFALKSGPAMNFERSMGFSWADSQCGINHNDLI
jgi:hypothetical protein